MHPELIKARLRMAGYTLAEVARQTNKPNRGQGQS